MTRFYTGQSDTFARLNDMPVQNLVINGRFDVWQKAASYALTTSFAFGGPDRFTARQLTSAQTTISQAAPSPALAGFKNCMKILLTGTSTGGVGIISGFETIDCVPFQGKDVVLSFCAVKGSTWNPTSLAVKVQTGTGTDQASSSIDTWTGAATPVNSSAAPTTAWVRYEFTGTIPATATQIGVQFGFTPTGAAVDANSYLMIAGMRLEPGTKASDFDSVPFEYELARCKRHLRVEAFKIPQTVTVSERIGMRAIPTITGGGAGYSSTGTTADAIVHFQTTNAVATLTLAAEL